MEITFKSRFFEFLIRTSKMYSIEHETFFPAAINLRICKYLWSTQRGFRKLDVN